MWGIAVIILMTVVAVPIARWYMKLTVSDDPDRELEISDNGLDRLKRAQWVATWRTDWRFWKRLSRFLVLVALIVSVAGVLALFV
jgi:hypothetical protein